jgi:uncharacterized protein YkwD
VHIVRALPAPRLPHLGVTLAAAFAVTAAAPQAASPAADRLVADVRLERQVAARVNLVRRWKGLRPLRSSRGLTAAARRHSRDMGLKGYFEHDSASGAAFWSRIEASYPSRGFARWVVGENIAWSSPRATAGEVVRQWMDSPPHRANMLSRTWRELGLGAFRIARAGGAYGGRAVTLVTLDLGARVR